MSYLCSTIVVTTLYANNIILAVINTLAQGRCDSNFWSARFKLIRKNISLGISVKSLLGDCKTKHHQWEVNIDSENGVVTLCIIWMFTWTIYRQNTHTRTAYSDTKRRAMWWKKLYRECNTMYVLNTNCCLVQLHIAVTSLNCHRVCFDQLFVQVNN